MRLNRRFVNVGLAASLVAPAFSRVARAADNTVKIGMVLSVTGPGADGGKYALAGAKIALDRVNKAGGVLGKQVELITEDDLTTNPGAVLAFSKLAVQPDIVAFLGEVRSTQNHAMAPDILKTGKPVCFGGTDPKLTKMGNPWLIRFRPNDTYSGRVIAAYGVATLGKKNWAIVHSTDAFGTSGFQALSASLDKLGAKIAIDQGYPNQSQDLTPVVLAVKSSGADIIGSYFTFPNDQAIFARQLRQLGVTLPWVGSPTTFLTETVKLAGPALWGTYSVADFAIDSSPEAKEFAALYGAVSNVQPDITVRGPMMRSACSQPQSIRRGRPIPTRSAPPSFHQRLQGRRGRIQFRRVRRRPARLQYRAQREGNHRFRQAHRIHRLTGD